jgi:hypothetical protein
MRKFLCLLAVAAAMTFVLAGSAGAVVYGTPDGNNHPYVGVVRFWDAKGNYLWRCSGTMISPKVMLTAGHCTSGTATARVWLSEIAPTLSEIQSGTASDPGLVGTPHANPDYNDFATFPNTHDVGVVVLKKSVSLSTYGALPTPGYFDTLATQRGLQNELFTVVGYGLQGVKPEVIALVQRFYGTGQLINLGNALTDGYNIQLTGDAGAAHQGELCFGDSGGPEFYGTSNLIAAVNSFVLNYNCAGTGFGHRVDIAAENAWIRSFLK